MATETLEARSTGEGTVTFRVRVSARARRDAIEGVAQGALRVRLASPPVEGRANQALRRFLAERLNIPQSAVRIVAGEYSRLKRVEISGATLDRVLALASGIPQ